MQQAWMPLQKVAALCYVEPYGAVSLEREAARAEGILARGDIAVGQEFAAACATYRAVAATTNIGKAHNRHYPASHTLQPAARNVVQGPAYSSLHRLQRGVVVDDLL